VRLLKNIFVFFLSGTRQTDGYYSVASVFVSHRWHVGALSCTSCIQVVNNPIDPACQWPLCGVHYVPVASTSEASQTDAYCKGQHGRRSIIYLFALL